MIKKFKVMAALLSIFLLVGCGNKVSDNSNENMDKDAAKEKVLIYGSGDYTSINPALFEHGEINSLLFNGLTAHDKDNNIIPALAKSWEYDEEILTYTFHLRDDVKWHDGEPFTAEDVKFTYETINNPDNGSEIATNYEDITNIEIVDDYTVKITLKNHNVAILDYLTYETINNPDNGSEIATNYEDITNIEIVDDYTVKITLKNHNVAILDYLSVGIIPKHILEGQDIITSDFNRHPIGTGPYRFNNWDQGQSITLVKNEDYFRKSPKIDKIIFKIVNDTKARVMQLKSGELDLAQVTPKDIETFKNDDNFVVDIMKTSDYRGIMYNFNYPLFKENRELPNALSYAIDREAIVDNILLGYGDAAYSPLQMGKYNNAEMDKFEYNPEKAKQLLEDAGWKLGSDGIYSKNGTKLSFELVAMEGDQERIDMANFAVQEFKKIGADVKLAVKADIDWDNQAAFVIGWGSPFDPDDHTYKVFSTHGGANYNAYSNEKIDEYIRYFQLMEVPIIMHIQMKR